MVVAVLSLVGIFVSVYLALYNYGFLGVIQCTVGGCETVQSSAYAWFPPRTVSQVGVPVSVMGIAAYGVLFALAIRGIQPGRAGERWIAWAIFGVAAVGVAFSAYLTYLEAFVIHAWCQWCVASAVLVTVIFLFSIPGLKEGRNARETLSTT